MMKRKIALILILILCIGVICVMPLTYASEEKSVRFNSHDDVIYPCVDVVKEYLLAGANADITSYEYHIPLQAQPVTLSWEAQGISVSGYELEIATQSDFSNAKTITLSPDTTSYSFKYLLRDTKYYVRIKTTGADVYSAQTEFSTAYGCPRFLDVGGLYNNCRDLGGYRVGDKKVLQNMVIRGSSPDRYQNGTAHTMTEDGYEFLTKEVGIKTQLDFRGSSETHGRTTSSFTSASNYINIPLTAYAACFNASQAEYYRQTFSLFANEENYPIYFHCAGGADRTGTVAAILLAYLGVSEDEIIQDYVVTSFSPVCYSQDARARSTIMPVINGLKNYSGETLSEKTETFLSSIGLTKRELFNIKAIMFGESVDDYVPETDYSVRLSTNYYNTTSNESFEITLNENNPVSHILIGETAVEFTQNNCTLTIPATSLINIADGSHNGEVVFSDGVKTEFTIFINIYDLTGELQVSETTYEGDYQYVSVEAKTNVFTGIGWHFQTRRSTLYPDVQPNILINGTSVAELNDTTDMSGFTFNTFPGSTDARHRVPVTIQADNNVMKLVCHKEWLDGYLNGEEMKITFLSGFSYTYSGVTYKVLSDIMYQYTGGNWVKVVAENQTPTLIESEFEIYSSTSDDLLLSLDISGKAKTVTIDGTAVLFTQNDKVISIKNSAIKNLTGGIHTGTIVFENNESVSFTITVMVDLGESLTYAGNEQDGDYTYVKFEAPTAIFTGIEWHFHTKRSTLYPDVQPNILINGTSVAELNDTTDMSGFTFNTFPGSTDARHRVPVTIRARDNTLMLVIHNEWLGSYLSGNKLEIEFVKGLNYTYNNVKYEFNKNIKQIMYADMGDITFVTDGKTFSAQTKTDVAAEGILFVALYSDLSAKSLAEIKSYDVSAGNTVQGTFEKNGKYIKVFWMKNFENISPVTVSAKCELN